eukprot:365396-Chlamydomonas_euryale.AAC.24
MHRSRNLRPCVSRLLRRYTCMTPESDRSGTRQARSSPVAPGRVPGMAAFCPSIHMDASIHGRPSTSFGHTSCALAHVRTCAIYLECMEKREGRLRRYALLHAPQAYQSFDTSEAYKAKAPSVGQPDTTEEPKGTT